MVCLQIIPATFTFIFSLFFSQCECCSAALLVLRCVPEWNSRPLVFNLSFCCNTFLKDTSLRSALVFLEDRCLPTSPTQLLAHQHHILQTSANVHAAAMMAMENAQKQSSAQVLYHRYKSN